MRVLHLNNGKGGMAAETACGRNIFRTPFSCNWDEYKEAANKGWQLCARCESSKLKAVYEKRDAKQALKVDDLDQWEPLPDEVWQAEDSARLKIARAKRRGVSFITN